MTNEEILKIALKQSSYDCNCDINDFLSESNKIVLSQKNEKARAYLPLPFEFDLISYGNNIVAQVSERMYDTARWYLAKYEVAHAFESPNVIALNEKLSKFDYKVCFMAEYFLPDVTKLKELDCPFELKILTPKDFAIYYTPQWENALSSPSRKHLDILAVGAFHNDKLIGLAGASADCESMYQIGVDVSYEYRKMGVASAVVSKLAIEILKLGKVPFYCCAWSNLKSVRTALKSGFVPSWVELTARDSAFVDKMNS